MTTSTHDPSIWLVRALRWFGQKFRPQLGWFTFVMTLLLVLLPVMAVRMAGWVNVRRSGVVPEWVVLVGVAIAWFVATRWQAMPQGPSPERRPARAARAAGWLLIWLLAGLLTLTQVLARWLPSSGDLWRAARSGAWLDLLVDAGADLSAFGWRLGQWVAGVQAGGAVQDDLVFLAIVSVLLWLMASATAWLAVRHRNGLLMALPSLWFLALALYYGDDQRLLLIVGLGVTIVLHLWLDQITLVRHWEETAVDYNPDVLYDRILYMAGVALLILTIALVLPSFSVRPVARWAYVRLEALYQPAEDLAERLFPDLERRGQGGYAGVGSGLPNRFLLGSGPDLAEIPVMWVRADLPPPRPDQPPPRLYMRRATFASYTGRGWERDLRVERDEFAAQRAWFDPPWQGRSLVRQQVRMASPTSILYAAGEPLVPELAYQAAVRTEGDLLALWVDQGTVERYQVISTVPAVDETTLQTMTGAGVLPDALAIHLELPDTVTERTRALAAEIGADLVDPYAKAEAIESYLRQYTYDLDVPAPPADADVADYFLFDLQRGYCDYYATAFAVLARLNGLPTRFATGYVPGSWHPDTQEWTITEAEAHSWPEVYFPEVGWISFEPTAGRAPLSRVAFGNGQAASDVLPTPGATGPEIDPDLAWNWQMLFWLLPLIGVLYLLWQWIERRQPRDPWSGLVTWGARLGRPLSEAETELEYGRALVVHLEAVESEPERRRRLSRTVQELVRAVSEVHYGPDQLRSAAAQRAADAWQRIRQEIRRFWW